MIHDVEQTHPWCWSEVNGMLMLVENSNQFHPFKMYVFP